MRRQILRNSSGGDKARMLKSCIFDKKKVNLAILPNYLNKIPMYKEQISEDKNVFQKDVNSIIVDISPIQRLIADEMARVNTFIEENLASDVSLINQLGQYIVNSGGKRLRPALVILSSKVLGYEGDKHINLAAIIELIHTATLLHDDVVDASLLRRGHQTANQRWGNEASVLVGDFVYSRAFQMMVDINSLSIMRVLSEATNTIAEGEVQQLIYRHRPETSEENYLDVIRNKTAKLFEAAARLGSIISKKTKDDENAMANYGRHLGTAFQLIDDVLDYSSSEIELGKSIGDDLSQGNPTLPLLYAMWNSTKDEEKIIRNSISNGSLENIELIKDTINSTGAISYTIEIAKRESELAINALDKLPQSEYLDALYMLAKFSVDRQN
jgi:octaprenyl-diphosphate synthase|tara:strand:+ start:668 stop:1822 length:1155 start_codon:yes stop_codon:yes gene_type:complete